MFLSSSENHFVNSRIEIIEKHGIMPSLFFIKPDMYISPYFYHRQANEGTVLGGT